MFQKYVIFSNSTANKLYVKTMLDIYITLLRYKHAKQKPSWNMQFYCSASVCDPFMQIKLKFNKQDKQILSPGIPFPFHIIGIDRINWISLLIDHDVSNDFRYFAITLQDHQLLRQYVSGENWL